MVYITRLCKIGDRIFDIMQIFKFTIELFTLGKIK